MDQEVDVGGQVKIRVEEDETCCGDPMQIE